MLDDLIVRLEAATEGSQELWTEVNAHAFEQGWITESQFLVNSRLIVAAFSEAIDDPNVLLAAALTLVPEGLDIDLYIAARQDNIGQACVVDILHSETDEKLGTGSRSSPALALCIAVLKARANAPAHR